MQEVCIRGPCSGPHTPNVQVPCSVCVRKLGLRGSRPVWLQHYWIQHQALFFLIQGQWEAAIAARISGARFSRAEASSPLLKNRELVARVRTACWYCSGASLVRRVVTTNRRTTATALSTTSCCDRSASAPHSQSTLRLSSAVACFQSPSSPLHVPAVSPSARYDHMPSRPRSSAKVRRIGSTGKRGPNTTCRGRMVVASKKRSR